MESVRQLSSEKKYDDLATLVEMFLDEKEDETTIIEACLSFITEKDFKRLLIKAIGIIQKEENDIAVSIIDYCALQFPEMFIPYLEEFVYLIPSRGDYNARWMWRKAQASHIEKLERIIRMSNSFPEQKNAWECLTNIDSIEGIKAVKRIVKDKVIDIDLGLESLFLGYELLPNGISELNISKYPFHILFPQDYFKNSNKNWHPSWGEKNDNFDIRFGGVIESKCGCCGRELCHLIQVPKATFGLEHDLTLATCLSCLGWEKNILFYKHDFEGNPKDINSGGALIIPEYPSMALLECNIKIERTPNRWIYQDWGMSNGRENLNRLGGKPSWIQYPEYLECPECKRTLNFLGQLDSNLPTQDREFLWGSGGIGYMHYCIKCSISGIYWQCT